MTTYNSPNSLSIDNFATVVGNSVENSETDLQTSINALGKTPTQESLLLLQQKMQTWSMLVSLQATVIKEIGDTLKGIIQKSA
ncbi:EscF/YscF/HrpA family type III secretion system needle major subunit [Paraburkholderia hayleyella]|uniref:EscF/YscF/HrpA family type III secretion system needle major subunit n=1 Tax=Paraburkholderia hayleyella TaxID=2152889 RepID=UPI001290C40D|nr:EscF/YscF/HrpA family type III secretion system needle major subunit [Paraburkholderia hayleyella]